MREDARDGVPTCMRVAPCSGLSRPSPAGWPRERPVLTAPARGAPQLRQVGTKERPLWHEQRNGAEKAQRVCSLISMMARSTARSNQRPDTLMQDRKADRSTKVSCNARPCHTLRSKNLTRRHHGCCDLRCGIRRSRRRGSRRLLNAAQFAPNEHCIPRARAPDSSRTSPICHLSLPPSLGPQWWSSRRTRRLRFGDG